MATKSKFIPTPPPEHQFGKDRPHPYRGKHLDLEHRAKLKVARRINLGQVAEENREIEEARILAELRFAESVKTAVLV